MVSLNGTWRLQGFMPGVGVQQGVHLPTYDDGDWLQAEVPGDVYAALRTAGLIEDPYYHDYVERCRWVEEREWWYRRSFQVPTTLQGDRIELTFSGIDTLGTIYLDGETLGDTRNMFRPYAFDVTDRVRMGERHVLAVRLDPVAPYLEQLHEERKAGIPGFWSAFHEGRVWVRKSQMHFGWDWAPRLVACGLWQGVELNAYRLACVRSIFLHTLRADPRAATVACQAEIERFREEPLEVEFILEEPGGGDWRSVRTVSVQIEPALSSAQVEPAPYLATATFEVPEPKLWWTHDRGEPNLYRLRVEIKHQGVPVQTVWETFGIRTMELDQSPGEQPETKHFTLRLNGEPIFCRGANWVPADGRTGAISPERYHQLLYLARKADINMLRVWGGGVYEPDWFYDLCDELGILVWQDFMFSCATYPDHDEEFMEEVRQEGIAQIKRLRHHPCLALWCGNNENQWIDDLFHWNEGGRRVPGYQIYHELLPALCSELDPSRPYWYGSPYGGDDHNDERQGDRHNWQVWGGQVYPRRFGEPPRHDPSSENVNYRQYAHDLGRFVSEFGIHGSPPFITLRQTIPPQEQHYESYGFLNRIKDSDLKRKDTMMSAHTGLPLNLEQYVLYSMLVQAEGLKFGIEHYRRRKFECSGCLFWQFNDSWPGISWSVLDYYLRPKASYYYVKRAYAPVAASLVWRENALEVWLTNDTLQWVVTQAELAVVDFEGNRQWHEVWEAFVEPNESRLSLRVENPPLTGLNRLVAWVRSRDEVFPTNVLLFKEFKDLSLPAPNIQVEVLPVHADLCCYDFKLFSDVYAHFVHLLAPVPEAEWSDNYFPLLPGDPLIVRATSPVPFSADEVQVHSFEGG